MRAGRRGHELLRSVHTRCALVLPDLAADLTLNLPLCFRPVLVLAQLEPAAYGSEEHK
jgi:hypothetical protein